MCIIFFFQFFEDIIDIYHCLSLKVYMAYDLTYVDHGMIII